MTLKIKLPKIVFNRRPSELGSDSTHSIESLATVSRSAQMSLMLGAYIVGGVDGLHYYDPCDVQRRLIRHVQLELAVVMKSLREV